MYIYIVRPDTAAIKGAYGRTSSCARVVAGWYYKRATS